MAMEAPPSQTGDLPPFCPVVSVLLPLAHLACPQRPGQT